MASGLPEQGVSTVKFKIEFDREVDGRWIAEIAELPGVMAYGQTKEEALSSVQAIALRVLADRIEEKKAPYADSYTFACA